MAILNNLFINVLVIIAFTSLLGYLYKEKIPSYNSKLLDKAIFGLIGSAMAIILMYYSFKIPNTTIIIDLRFFALIYVFHFVGLIPTIITGLGIIIYRVTFYGFDYASIITIFAVIGDIIAYVVVNRYYKYKKSLFYLFSILIFILSLTLKLRNLSDLFMVFLIYIPFSLIAYIIMFALVNHLENSNKLLRKYKEESSKDFLTGLYNTRQYDLLFNSISNNIVDNNQRLAYLLIDIDFFKKVNDTYGHNVGDKVLIHLADIIKTNCTSTDIISRIGGEEFCVLSLGADLVAAKILAEKIRFSVEKYSFYINELDSISLTISIGLSVYPQLTKDIHNLKGQADIALYKAKQSGRNKVCF